VGKDKPRPKVGTGFVFGAEFPTQAKIRLEWAKHLAGPSTLAIQLPVYLPVEREVVDAVLLPTSFVVFGAERFFFAVADGADAIGSNSFLN
jgi:hypothetical protein